MSRPSQDAARASLERLGLDASTVFRTLRRLERGLGQPLFERTRSGYIPSELARQLAEHGERIEAALEAARSALAVTPAQTVWARRSGRAPPR